MHMMSARRPVAPSSLNAQRGVGLIEVLVALLVLSIGVLGYAGLQLRALDSTDEAQFRTQAVALGTELMERMRSNPLGIYDDPLIWPAGPLDNNVPGNWNACIDALCGTNGVRDWDVNQMAWQAWNNLPQGRMRAEPCPAPSPAMCITIAWDLTDPAACDPAADSCVRMEFLR